MEKEKDKGISEAVTLPNGIKCEIDGHLVKLEGERGAVSKKLFEPRILLKQQDGKIIISSNKETKREKKLVGTFRAHIKNMIKGVKEGHFYKLKICSGHFPMNVSVSGDEFIIKNFLGEKIPRKMKIKKGASIKIEGDIINVEGNDKEIVSQVAAEIEQLTRISDKDLRVFQDGIYIIEKDGKEIK